jgi:hypothetical protein
MRDAASLHEHAEATITTDRRRKTLMRRLICHRKESEQMITSPFTAVHHR